MNDLRSFAVLQARVYEFLEQQDEATLQAIASGTVQLAVIRPDAEAPTNSTPHEDLHGASRPASASLGMIPSRDPMQVAFDLSRLTSEHERRIYLNAADLPVEKGLKKVAGHLRLAHRSKLKKAELIDRLVSHNLEQTEAVESRTQTLSTSDPVDGNTEAEQPAAPQEAQLSTGTTESNANLAAIAARLRETETEEEGAAYLHAQHLDRESLLAIAAELGLTRVDRLRQTELEKRVLKQAIGARRKFAGLRKW